MGRSAKDAVVARAHLMAVDGRLATLIEARPDYDPHATLTELPMMDPFGVLLFQIIGQQISVAATRAILARLLIASGGVLPSPSQLLQMDPQTLLTAGISHRKTTTMRATAQVFLDQHLDEQNLAAMSDNDIEATLTAIPGVGSWTVQGFLVIALDRPDAFPAGDLAIRRAVRDLYHLESLPSEEEVGRRAELWRPHRALAAGHLITTMTRKPVRP
jgi:DNA-3-methyladenine glycosylase II